MKQIFKKVIEAILYGGDVNMIVYIYFKETYEEVGHTLKNSPEIKFEEFIRFCQKGGLTRKPYFTFTNNEMKTIQSMRGITDVEVYREDFNWAKKSANINDLRERREEARQSGLKDDMFGEDEKKIKMARDIMNNPTIKYKSDKIKALLREEFTDNEVCEIMNKRDDMLCPLSYILTIHKGLLNGTIK